MDLVHDLVCAGGNDGDAVSLDLMPPEGEQLVGGKSVACQKALHVCSGRVARRPGIDHRHPAARPSEHEGCTRAGSTAADHHYVISRHLHEPESAVARPSLQRSLLFLGIDR